MIQKTHHVAIAVKNLDTSLAIYTNVFGLKGQIQELKEYSLKLAFVEVGETLVELIQPTTKNDPLGFYSFIENAGEGLHHIAYKVKNINATLEVLKKNKISMIDQKPKQGADGMIAFANKESMGGVLVEFVETSKK